MKYARENSFAVFTHDLDFATLLARGKDCLPSVIQIRSEDVLPSAMGEVVLRESRELDLGALVTVDVKRHRIRMLPID